MSDNGVGVTAVSTGSDSNFRIVSLLENNPLAGIDYTEPTYQNVRLNEPVSNWVLKQVGDQTYQLSVGGYPYTGIDDNRVIVSIDSEQDVQWHVTYREDQDGYTIEPAQDQSKGWTVPPDLSTNPVIEVDAIVSTKSVPPQFSPSQLFRFEPVD